MCFAVEQIIFSTQFHVKFLSFFQNSATINGFVDAKLWPSWIYQLGLQNFCYIEKKKIPVLFCHFNVCFHYKWSLVFIMWVQEQLQFISNNLVVGPKWVLSLFVQEWICCSSILLHWTTSKQHFTSHSLLLREYKRLYKM